MIEIYLLEQLAAFAQYGTLSKAAEELHISQPALSRSMKKLEEDLGVKLFVRESKKISLNETGQLAAALAQSQVNQNKEMVMRIRRSTRHSSTLFAQRLSTDKREGAVALSSNKVKDRVARKGLPGQCFRCII